MGNRRASINKSKYTHIKFYQYYMEDSLVKILGKKCKKNKSLCIGGIFLLYPLSYAENFLFFFKNVNYSLINDYQVENFRVIHLGILTVQKCLLIFNRPYQTPPTTPQSPKLSNLKNMAKTTTNYK